ncbi:hypothetical protein CERSUDRAFT_81110 [Gelatoporia subvermispora B]|uniref:Uncharacterized protein n=1 Tax=Ceriporiopsis subvermispora (strain B) TaxID=914234 RepID=M2PSU1_CERS8|nr:hypothetical protein CERSUDRAFT_81110 [Gelatoporia subvermispora B]
MMHAVRKRTPSRVALHRNGMSISILNFRISALARLHEQTNGDWRERDLSVLFRRVHTAAEIQQY